MKVTFLRAGASRELSTLITMNLNFDHYLTENTDSGSGKSGHPISTVRTGGPYRTLTELLDCAKTEVFRIPLPLAEIPSLGTRHIVTLRE